MIFYPHKGVIRMELVYFAAFMLVVTFVYSLSKIFAQSDVAAGIIHAALHERKEP